MSSVKYTKVGNLGDGAYSKIYEARNEKTRKHVAMKRALIDHDDEGDFALSIKEISLLKSLQHPNIVHLQDLHYGNPFGSDLSPLKDEYRDDAIWMVFPKADKDGRRFATSNASFAMRKKAILGFLLGLRYMHKNRVIHRDLKPSNLLCFYIDHGPKEGKEAVLRIADLGMARDNSSRDIKSAEVITIWYRPLEILLGNRNYTEKADIWSAGCTIFELMCGSPLFYGDNSKEMFTHIFKFLGEIPSKESLEEIANGKVLISFQKVAKPKVGKKFPNYRQNFLHHKSHFAEAKVKEFNKTPGKYAEFLDLLDNMLQIDPEKRFSIDQVLAHPFFSGYKDAIARDKYSGFTSHKVYFAPKRAIGIKVINQLLEHHSVKQRKFNQIRFQSLDMLDRVLLADEKYRKENDQPALEDDLIELYAFVCVYITLKCLDTSSVEPIEKMAELVTDMDYNFKQFGDVEEYILKTLLDYRVFRTTVYELTDPSSSQEEIKSLWKVMCKCESLSGSTLEEILKLTFSVVKEKTAEKAVEKGAKKGEKSEKEKPSKPEKSEKSEKEKPGKHPQRPTLATKREV